MAGRYAETNTQDAVGPTRHAIKAEADTLSHKDSGRDRQIGGG